MRTILVWIIGPLATIVFATLIFLGRLFRLPDTPGGLFDSIPRWWSRTILTAAGVRMRVHNPELIRAGEPRIFVCNHVSWFDVLAVAGTLPRGKFVAKAELAKIPFFGFGMRALDMIEIERTNRKSAFASYEVAAQRIRDGTPVVVFPEGTRGYSYTLRPFKKGPFVLAITAGAPIVPVALYGTMEVMRKGRWSVHSGDVHVHFLEEVSTEGYVYEDRDRLAAIVRERMSAALWEHHGVSDTAAPPGMGSASTAAEPAAG
ncbi:MAG TPA: lysophospholipid acyltransferase family protein [Gemmatimonadaceae bacterium]|nr:lysophospholipid acyltransferase family protein [Gemmatimonadaceae bacterium]